MLEEQDQQQQIWERESERITFKFQPLYTDRERHNRHRHRQTDRQTDRRQYRTKADRTIS